MQSCPKNVDTGALIGNGKGAPVVSGPGLSLPPSAMVGPPSPARGLAGLAPPHGANAWDTDRVQINTHRNLNQNQPPSVPPSHNLVGGHSRLQNQDCRSKDEKNCTEDTLRKCDCQNACTSTCEVKMETLSPTEKLSVGASCPSNKYHNFKLENNNVKCESCSMEIADGLPCVANCNVVKCESDYKCDIMKCEQCMKEGQIAILEMDKDSGIVLDDKLDGDPNVKEELDVVVIDGDENWKKPDYEPTVQETVDDKDEEEDEEEEEITQGPVVAAIEAEAEQLKCQKVTKRKLSLDSLSDSRTKRKLSKRALSVGSSQDSGNERSSNVIAPIEPLSNKIDSVKAETNVPKKKQAKKDAGPRGQKRKAEAPSANESATKKAKSGKQGASNNVMNCLKRTASDISIMETIDDVIQQSLQMTQRKDRKNKNNCERVEKKKKNVKEESLLTVKRIVKKIDHVKEQFIEKVTKAVSKSSNQSKSKADAKPKSKALQDAKVKGKSKAKILAEMKTQDTKSRTTQDSKARDGSKKRDTMSKTKASDVSEDPKKPAVIKKKRKSTAKKTANAKKSGCKPENSLIGNENLTLTRKTFLKPKWNNGWSWEGEPFEAKVYLTNEETAIRRCYASMSHESGDVLRPRDCVLLKSGTRKGDLPYVAKIAALWENPDDGEMMFSLLWYYRPEHTEQGRTPHDSEDEVFASRHRDANSVACIEDKCYILTFNEYCRYRKNLRRIEEGLENPGLIVPPGDQVYPRENRQPPIPVPSDMVLFCRRVYDYRGKKLVKNPG